MTDQTNIVIKAMKLVDNYHKSLLPEAFKVYIKKPDAGAFLTILGSMALVFELNQKFYDDFSQDDLKQLQFVMETIEHFIEMAK